MSESSEPALAEKGQDLSAANGPAVSLQFLLKRLLGPGLLVAVGYMDPGNWATDIAAGSKYHYSLLSVVIVASLLGMLFQILSVRLAMATGEDLAQLTRRMLPGVVARVAWIAGEAAILATALAELVGGAVALELLFDLPMSLGLLITAAGTLLVLMLSGPNHAWHERIVNALLGVVALAFLVLLVRSHPQVGEMWSDVLQSPATLVKPDALVIALGILGATVMPHNLYLHSGLIAERRRALPARQHGQALRLATGDTVMALTIALFVNAAILIVSGASLSGLDVAITSLEGAHQAIGLSLGAIAALLFAVALYAAGQSSAITGVVAGGMLTRGFHGRTGSMWMRGIVTRVIAVSLAFLVMTTQAGTRPDTLLVWSQVILSLALPFALVPLVWLSMHRELMGPLRLRGTFKAVAIGATALVVVLDLYLLMTGW
ncbi:Nramp family divalent metal transporter [Halomonas shantousis]